MPMLYITQILKKWAFSMQCADIVKRLCKYKYDPDDMDNMFVIDDIVQCFGIQKCIKYKRCIHILTLHHILNIYNILKS